MKKTFLIILLLSLFFVGFSQTDTSKIVKKDTLIIDIKKVDAKKDSLSSLRNPRKAAIMSAIIPGLGQAYNQKYWKIPVIYTAMGLAIYFNDYNYKQYKRYLNAYIAESDTLPGTVSEFGGKISKENLLHNKDYFRRNRDISFLALVLVYFFNIIDATVDSHLFDFDVGDDLSLKILPTVIPAYNAQGLQNFGLSIYIRF